MGDEKVSSFFLSFFLAGLTWWPHLRISLASVGGGGPGLGSEWTFGGLGGLLVGFWWAFGGLWWAFGGLLVGFWWAFW